MMFGSGIRSAVATQPKQTPLKSDCIKGFEYVACHAVTPYIMCNLDSATVLGIFFVGLIQKPSHANPPRYKCNRKSDSGERGGRREQVDTAM